MAVSHGSIRWLEVSMVARSRRSSSAAGTVASDRSAAVTSRSWPLISVVAAGSGGATLAMSCCSRAGWRVVRAKGSGSNVSGPARSRARSPMSSWRDRIARRSSRLLPCPPSTLASRLPVWANAAGVVSAASASAPSKPGRSAGPVPGGEHEREPGRGGMCRGSRTGAAG